MSMSTSTEVIAHHWAFAIFLIVAIGLCCLMLVGGWFLGGRARARSKNVPFESGIDSVGSARLRLSAKFYLVAMFFVIFDVEALYLFAWSTSIRESVDSAILGKSLDARAFTPRAYEPGNEQYR